MTASDPLRTWMAKLGITRAEPAHSAADARTTSGESRRQRLRKPRTARYQDFAYLLHQPEAWIGPSTDLQLVCGMKSLQELQACPPFGWVW